MKTIYHTAKKDSSYCRNTGMLDELDYTTLAVAPLPATYTCSDVSHKWDIV